jgi:hypothetical protein
MNPMCHMQTTYKQVQIHRNVKLFINVVTLIAQTEGSQQNKQVQLTHTQTNNVSDSTGCVGYSTECWTAT